MKEKMPKVKTIIMRFCILGLVLAAFCCGCSPQYGDLLLPSDTIYGWPKPPDKPRIIYLTSISSEADLHKETSWIDGIGELIFGKKDIGVIITPYALAIDDEEKLYVTDTAGAVVHMFDLKKRVYRQFGNMAGKEKLLNPVGLALVDNWIYVVDSKLHKVCVFDKGGSFVASFGKDRLTRPSGIAYRQDDKTVFVTDTARHTINVFARNGRFISQIGSRGLSPGMFNFPTHLWIDRSGKLYVGDTLNYRIQVFSRDLQFLNMFGQQGDRPGNFAHPCGVATDSYGNIYVTDRQFENVQLFDQRGQLLMAFGEEGTQPGRFWLPAGVFIDNKNRIFVADSFNKRIQIFKLIEQVDK